MAESELPAPPGDVPGDTLAGRVRALWTARADHLREDSELAAGLRAALDRHSARPRVQVTGAAGSGAAELARLLERRLRASGLPATPRVVTADPDHTPDTPPAVQDAEVYCLVTAPCAHERAWLARPRDHSVTVVATHPAGADGPDPAWATALPHVPVVGPREAAGADPSGLTDLTERVLGALGRLDALREERLRIELDMLAAPPEWTETVELALVDPEPAGAS